MLYFLKINIFWLEFSSEEKENKEDHFWNISTPMPNLFFPYLSILTQTKKAIISNNENLGDLELHKPSVNVLKIGAEIL